MIFTGHTIKGKRDKASSNLLEASESSHCPSRLINQQPTRMKNQFKMNGLNPINHTRNLCFLLSQYELLQRTAQHLSILDLFHVALTCHELHTVILDSPLVFNKLKRLSTCDGRGLIKRQTFTGLHKPYNSTIEGHARMARYDEEIEIRVYNLKCDAYNALPCLKCGINICEVCPPSHP